MTNHTPLHTDVLIVGAGPVGMTLSLALAAGGQKSLLLDRRPRYDQLCDPRALALSHGTRQLLEQIKAWPNNRATAIKTIHVSEKSGFGHTLIECTEYRLPALGYVVRYHDLAAALNARISDDVRLDCTEILDIARSDDHIDVRVSHAGQHRTIRIKLLVHAEGTIINDPEVITRDYQQHAVIAEITPVSVGHEYRAWERFTPDGPLALLPLGKDYAVIFTLPPAKADAIMALDNDTFAATLQSQCGLRLQLTQPTPRQRFPLALSLRKTLVKNREVWIGNSAQTLHPVAGQGFNLGMRDAWQLAETLLDQSISTTSLSRYATSRCFDRISSTLFTDAIVRAFSNDIGALKLARGLGLLALNLCPPARHFVAHRMIWGARAWL